MVTLTRLIVSPHYRRQTFLVKPFKGFCKKLSRAREIKMQEEYISKLSEFPSVERVAQVKDVVDAVELKLRGGMLLMAL